METHFHPGPLAYDGRAIRAHWILRRFGLRGDAAAAFVGPLDVRPDAVADMDEVISGAPIRGARMVHVVAEHFGATLSEGIARLHLLAALAFEQLVPRAPGRLVRRGDDLYLGEGKLSVGVATATPVSVTFHFGVNVTRADVPVAAAALEDLGVDPESFAQALLAAYAREVKGLAASRATVRAVGEADGND